MTSMTMMVILSPGIIRACYDLNDNDVLLVLAAMTKMTMMVILSPGISSASYDLADNDANFFKGIFGASYDSKDKWPQ